MNKDKEMALTTGLYICSECGSFMDFEDENEDNLICPDCGHECLLEDYGEEDVDFDTRYPSKEDICGPPDDDEEDIGDGEMYEEVYGELDDAIDD